MPQADNSLPSLVGRELLNMASTYEVSIRAPILRFQRTLRLQFPLLLLKSVRENTGIFGPRGTPLAVYSARKSK